MAENELRTLLEIDRLIHEPARLLLVNILYVLESADFLYLLNETGLTRGNLSSHLGKLEEGGYLTIEKTYSGKTPLTILHISAAGRAAYEAYSQQIRLGLLPETARGKGPKK